MLRFLLPAFLMVGALVALFAGASGDWQGLSDSWDRLHTAVADLTHDQPAATVAPAPPAGVSQAAPAGASQTAPAGVSQAAPAGVSQAAPAGVSQAAPAGVSQAAPPGVSQAAPAGVSQAAPPGVSQAAPADVSQAAPTPNSDARQAAADTLRQQVAGLQAQVAQRTQELASLHADTDQARQELETLRLQHQTQAAESARHQEQVRQAEARARRARRDAVPAPPAFASTQPGLAVPPLTQLMAAREVLTSGRRRDARHLLATAQTQMVFQPVTPDQPDSMGGNRAATAVGEAIHLVDAGDIDQAIQAINRAIDITKSQNQGAGNTAPAPAAPPYSLPLGYRFANQP